MYFLKLNVYYLELIINQIIPSLRIYIFKLIRIHKLFNYETVQFGLMVITFPEGVVINFAVAIFV